MSTISKHSSCLNAVQYSRLSFTLSWTLLLIMLLLPKRHYKHHLNHRALFIEMGGQFRIRLKLKITVCIVIRGTRWNIQFFWSRAPFLSFSKSTVKYPDFDQKINFLTTFHGIYLNFDSKFGISAKFWPKMH